MKKLQLPEKALIQFFDLDIDNCLMTREDFCHCITDIMNNPKEIDYLFNELIIWVNNRTEKGWHIEKPIKTKDDLLKFWNKKGK